MDGYGPASYGDAFVDVYDDWYADISDVDATIAALARLAGDGPVLELGIGSGRLALPLAARGVAVWGIEASTRMLERLRAKPGGEAIAVAVGDMADVDLAALPGAPNEFAVVLIAFNTFFNLTDETAQRKCLRRAGEVLAPGGRLVIEAHVPDDEPLRGAVELRTMSSERVVLTVTRTADDRAVLVGEHVEIDASGLHRRPWVIRMCGLAGLDSMAVDAGLRLVERWASWDGDAYADGDPAHISLYEAR